MQHVYAITFAAIITTIIASGILYVDYGFWHERYSRGDEVLVSELKNREAEVTESPSQMISSFFSEAKEQLGTINTTGRAVFDGKEVYRKEE